MPSGITHIMLVKNLQNILSERDYIPSLEEIANNLDK